ncbi:DUF1588 domain-containing protein [Lignipirellula cremea]|uniref:Planctomycete cytochrome C n=1 Tax=Lignipirellula cremea TaxID=2528010 RepID=A0A518E491_9BACT|nr:DUF1588 domain-containing protein [Lignipirellula cremea]QDU98911.1 hypothetical protein Pla8534_68220 [Lignipirellula cremea]
MLRFLLNGRSFAAALWLVVFGTAMNCFGQQEQRSFETVVKPFLMQHCADCHSGDEPKARFDPGKLTPDFSQDETANRWIEVMHRLQFGEMPPPEEAQPDPIAKANVISWILQQMAKTNRYEAYQKKLLAPEYGNWVSHEKLFSGEIKTRPFSPSRLWRFSPEIFEGKGFPRARSPFAYVTRENGVRDFSAMSAVDQSTVQMILINADQLLEFRQQRGDFKDFEDERRPVPDQMLGETVRKEFRTVIGRDVSEEELARYLGFLKQNIQDGGSLDGLKITIKAMFLSPEAIYRMEFGLGETDEHGRRRLSPEETAYAIAYALTDRSPEHSAPIRNALRQGKLSSQQEVAAVVRQVLDEGLANESWDRPRLPRIRRFFEEFFGYNRAGAVFKDNDRRNREGIPQWNTSMLVHDALTLIEHHLQRDQDVIAELLTTNEYFVAHPGDNEFAREHYETTLAEVTRPDYVESQAAERQKSLDRNPNLKPEERENQLQRTRANAEQTARRFQLTLEAGLTPLPSFPFSSRSRGIADLIYIEPYNLPSSRGSAPQNWDWKVEQPFALPQEQRAGLLTHPAWLAAHSLNDGNDPIRRGIWIRERLLAGVIQDVPPDVDAKVPGDPHLTLRERLEPLRAERCWVCHRKMNPLGETFEIFDDWGRYRTHVYFDENQEMVTRRDAAFEQMLKNGDLKAREIDASGAISGSGDPEVDGEVKNAIEMMHRLGRSDRARQSFIRHLFRYLMGRNEMLSDSVTLIEAEQAYLKNGGSFRALVVSLLSSDSFLYRR